MKKKVKARKKKQKVMVKKPVIGRNIIYILAGLFCLVVLIFIGLKIVESVNVAGEERKKVEELAKVQKASILFLKAKKDYASGYYWLAEEKMSAALKLFPEREDYEGIYKKLHTISSIIPMETGQTKESELIRKGISCYLDGDARSCLGILSHVLSGQPKNEKLKDLYREINSYCKRAK